MNKHLRTAIEAVLQESLTCSIDTHGFMNHLTASKIAILHIEYDKECKKHFKPRIRPQAQKAA